MARGSRDLAKFLRIENGKRFKGLSQISSNRKWQEVQGDLDIFSKPGLSQILKRKWQEVQGT
jgi:hypothetical protein